MQTVRKLALAGTVAICAAGAGLRPFAHAQSQVVPPKPLEHARPQPPKNSFGIPMEGWVVVRYTVLSDGRTANVRVIDRMPPRITDREAVDAVSAWTFEPATDAGKTIEWLNNESVVIYDVDTIPVEPTPFFLQAYQEADALIKSEEREKALKRNELMLTTGTFRLLEVGLAQVQSALINMGLGDLHAAYAAILRATDPRVPSLGDDELKIALQYRYTLELELGDAQGAVDSFARRTAIDPVADRDPIAAKIASVKQGLAGNTDIIINARLANGSWWHTPSRRTFTIGNVKGELENIHIECDRRTADIAYAPDSEWSLPANWGACALLIQGPRDAEFQFYEFR